MIYTNFVDLHSLMLHSKFQNHRPLGSEEEDFFFLRFLLFIAIVAILVFVFHDDKIFKVYMYVFIKLCDVVYSYLVVLICACTVIILLFYNCLSKKSPTGLMLKCL